MLLLTGSKYVILKAATNFCNVIPCNWIGRYQNFTKVQPWNLYFRINCQRTL